MYLVYYQCPRSLVQRHPHSSPSLSSHDSPSLASLSGDASYFHSLPPSTFDETATQMTSWTYSEGQQANFDAKFDPKDYISQWPILEAGPYDRKSCMTIAVALPQGASISACPPPPAIPAHPTKLTALHPNLSIQIQRLVPQHMLTPSQLLSSQSSSPFDFSIPADCAIHLNWGPYQITSTGTERTCTSLTPIQSPKAGTMTRAPRTPTVYPRMMHIITSLARTVGILEGPRTSIPLPRMDSICSA